MTKEELKQEAEEYLKNLDECKTKDMMRNAYLAGAEQIEKRIAELERKLEQTEKDLADYQFNYPTIKELEKENAEFKEQLYAFDEEREKLRKENTELKADNDAIKFAMTMSEKVEKQLREENAKLKEKLKPENCLKLLAKEGYIKFTSEQLTKARELLERLLITSCNSDVLNLLPNCSEVLRVRVEAEQFLSEVDK